MKLWRRSTAPTEGEKARQRAEADLARTMAETPMYRALGESLRQLREENHFAQAIRESMGGRAR